MSERSEGVSLGEGHVIRDTKLALLVLLEDLGDEQWIPKSVIHDDSEVYEASGEHSEGEVVVKRWFAEEKGLV